MKLPFIKHRKPARPAITVRRMGFQYDTKRRNRYWFGDNALQTHILNVLSLTFPDGERFFVDAVRALRDAVDDPQRQQEISGFIGQEAMHSMEHQAFNQLLADERYRPLVDRATKVTRQLLAGGRKFLSEKEQLAATAGLEHITAILANALLNRPDLIAEIDANVRPLWIWHAIEEIEHKAVAYDLYQDVDGSYWRRQRLFLSCTAYLIGFASYFTWQFLKQDRAYRQPLSLAKGAWKAFGYRGVISGAIPAWLTYLSPGFHPWNEDNSKQIEKWRATLPSSQQSDGKVA